MELAAPVICSFAASVVRLCCSGGQELHLPKMQALMQLASWLQSPSLLHATAEDQGCNWTLA